MTPTVATERSVHTLAERYRQVRAATGRLCEPLETEDYVVQSMPDASPIRWHLAHTSWFFETLVLKPALPGYEPIDETFAYLFNSYYNTLGDQFPRPRRGLLTRPTVGEVLAFRRHVDDHMERLFDQAASPDDLPADAVTVGLHHEQQHQELMLTDLKHLLAQNPLYPTYRRAPAPEDRPVRELGWLAHPGGLVEIGFAGDGFAYDNEGPRHRVYLQPFQLADRPVTCGEYLRFMEDGGYGRPDWWLSDGWDSVRREGWTAPLYWRRQDGAWVTFTLTGPRPVVGSEPLCHVSHYEADAYARWAGARLPTEAEWEVVAQQAGPGGNFVEDGRFHPAPADESGAAAGPMQMFGDVWEWTASAYTPYPGYRPPAGALGEYNSKFMSGQMVLRGGSCATPRSHIRATYRNFFKPSARWQFSGVRLARDAA